MSRAVTGMPSGGAQKQRKGWSQRRRSDREVRARDLRFKTGLPFNVKTEFFGNMSGRHAILF